MIFRFLESMLFLYLSIRIKYKPRVSTRMCLPNSFLGLLKNKNKYYNSISFAHTRGLVRAGYDLSNIIQFSKFHSNIYIRFKQEVINPFVINRFKRLWSIGVNWPILTMDLWFYEKSIVEKRELISEVIRGV